MCWLWTGSQRSKGYGAFVYVRDGLVVQGRAHRYSYELHIGKIPEGLEVFSTGKRVEVLRRDGKIVFAELVIRLW